MKILLTILITTISIVFGLFHYREMAGCEKSRQPPNTFIETCCPTLPHYRHMDLFIKCNKSCAMWLFNPTGEGSRKCCLLNCTYVEDGIMEKYGPFLPNKMIEMMKKNLTSKNSKWSETIEKVVNDCTKKGMSLDLTSIRNIMAQCETDNITVALNITQCIRREMFFACHDPQMSQSRCQSLIKFGRECSYWPWQCNHKRAHSGKYITPKPPGIV